MGLIEQEASTERWIEIPTEVHDIYRLWRPSPFYRAHRLEKALGTTARIYYKYEGASPVGSHKTNSAVPQAYFNKIAGRTRLTTETGAGQWGSALAFACQIFGLSCDIWQVRSSYEGKPYRHVLMETFGASVVASPSELTEAGRMLREQFPDTTGSLGMAISEAVEAAAKDENASYSLGSRAEPRRPAPDGDRPGGAEAARAVRRASGRLPVRVRRRRLEPGRDQLPVHPGEPRGPLGDEDHRLRAEGSAVAHRGRIQVRLRRHRAPDAAAEDVLPRRRLRARLPCTPAACATTACRRWSATATTRA